MILADILQHKPWKTLNQGKEGTCQGYAFFGMLMELVEQKYELKVEFDIERYYKEVYEVVKYSPKTDPPQWHFFNQAQKRGFKTKTGELVRITGFRFLKQMDNHELLMTSLQRFGAMTCGLRTFQGHSLKDEVVLPVKAGAKQTAGHEVFLIGFDKIKKMYQFQNSWGEKYKPGWIPFKVFEKLAYHCFSVTDILI